MKLGIIGGGAAGLVAAITAARNGVSVTILEHNDRVGKKLLATGNGKCNMTNLNISIDNYHGTKPSYAQSVLDRVSPTDVISFFNKLGLVTEDKNGYIYPYSMQASAVLDVLRFAAYELKINIVTECNINSIIKKDEFIVYSDKGEYSFDKLIIATGSKASPKTGSDGSGYKFLKSFGHTLVKPLPALTFLVSEDKSIKQVAGVRTKACISLYDNEGFLDKCTGELQHTKNGISGIPVFQLSYLAAMSLNEGLKVYALIDYLPDYSFDEVERILLNRLGSFRSRPKEEFLIGILNKNISGVIMKEALKNYKGNCEQIMRKDIAAIARLIKGYRVNVVNTGDYDNAQVCLGGVLTDELKDSLESRLVKNLYFAGEIIDIHGDCGGYNLQWAFATGIIAGMLE